MSRITAPASKLARAISTTSNFAAPSQMATSAAVAPRMAQSQESNNSNPSRRSFHPTPSSSASRDASTIDSCRMPNMAAFDALGNSNSFARMRVPLAPDNFVAHHPPEAVVAPPARPQIVVMAARPGTVMPAALTDEVDSFEYEGVRLGFAHGAAGEEGGERHDAGSMLKGIWSTLVEDVNVDGKGKVAL